MGPAYINYVGSLVFGGLTLSFLFLFFRMNQDRIAMLATIVAGACAWMSCYAGVLLDVSQWWFYTSVTFAGLSAFLTITLCIFAIRTFLHV